MSYSLGRVPQIMAGEGSLNQLASILKNLGSSSVCFIADGAMQNQLPKIVAQFELPCVQHTIPAGEPTGTSVNLAREAALGPENPCIVAIGGGSALDTGKQVAAILRGLQGIEHYYLCANPFPERTPIIAIPTTAGTGAEVTRTCIVSDDTGRKLWTWGNQMLPDAIILEPSLTVSVPPHVTAFTGLDAFVHALEAATSQRKNSLSSGMALQAMRLVRQHLVMAVHEPSNLQARLGMQEAALLAGMAIDNCGTGIAHNIGHALGTLYHLPHGIAVTLALEAALPWNLDQASSYTEAARVFETVPENFFVALQELLVATNFATVVKNLKPLLLEPDAIAAAMIAPENQPMLNNNCRIPSQTERLELARRTAAIWEAYRA